MRKFGLIGYPLSHSFSPSYFAKKFDNENILDTRYDLYPLERIGMIKNILDGSISGINVTIPYKELVIPYLDYLSDEVLEIRAVNTIKIEHGVATGYNTDIYGFEESLNRLCHGNIPPRALIFGTGGASKAAQYVLRKRNIEFLNISRSDRGDMTYKDLSADILSTYQLWINTTPVGMYPNIDKAPDLDYSTLTADHVMFDMIYNPEKTLFLRHGFHAGASTQNGLEMLELQAEKAWEIWNK